MTKEEMWKEFENQLVRETRTPMTMSYDASEKMIKSAIKETVAKWKERLEQQPSEDDCVSRKAVDLLCFKYLKPNNDDNVAFYEHFCDLPPVTITHGTCKDCKHWKDSDGVYRRGVDAESKCPINTKEVYEGNFYCKDFKKRDNLDG